MPMARKPSPWFRAERNEWCVTVNGQHHRLGEHPADAPIPRKSSRTGKWNAPREIEEAFHKLISDSKSGSKPVSEDAVAVVLDDFLTWTKEHRAPITAARYEEFCQDFIRFEVEDGFQIGRLPVAHLTSGHVTAWLRERPTWGPTTKRNAITAIQRGMNWAVKNRGLDRNPFKGMEKPKGKSRVEVVTPDEFEKLLAAVPDEAFRDLLVVSYDCGGRPFEVKDLEARHCRLAEFRAVIPATEAKGRKHTRIIYFPTERSLEVIRRHCEQYPEGPLFRNRLGNKWTGLAVKCRLEAMDHVLGRRVTHYALRHSFVTRKLVAGVDSHVVAKLAGHQDTKMLDGVYSHVADDFKYMLGQARKDVSPGKGSEA
jgi:integrase